VGLICSVLRGLCRLHGDCQAFGLLLTFRENMEAEAGEGRCCLSVLFFFLYICLCVAGRLFWKYDSGRL